MNKNILNKILLATLPFMAINANAATPQSFNYQSVIRSTSGTLVANQTVFVKVEILKDKAGSYEVVYSEMHNATTNSNGSFAIKIGEGSAASGPFSAIDWSANDYAIRTSTSTNTSFTDAAVAVSTLSSVPYALYALKSADSFSGYWDDLKEKPNMSEYAKVGDVASYAADSTRRILENYATKDDVLDLHNRGLRSNNYRIDSLRSVVMANDYWITELQSNAPKYATKAEISSFVKKDTLTSYATKANVSALTKSTNEAIAELNQTVNSNKALAEANDNNLKEIQKLYARKDTLRYFASKDEMSNYATSSAVSAIEKSVTALSSTVTNTDTRQSELTTTINNLSATVANNQKEANQKIDGVKSELDKVDDKIAASERKAAADNLLLENRIVANEGNISKLTTADSKLETKLNGEISGLSAQIALNNKKNAATVDSLAKVMTANDLAASKKTESKSDSLANAFNEKLEDLHTIVSGEMSKTEEAINEDLKEINKTLSSQSSSLASANTQITNLNGMIRSISTWANGVDDTNRTLSTELAAFKTKYKADSLKMEKRILTDSLKADVKYREMKDLALQYMSQASSYKDKLDKIEAKLGGKSIDEYVEEQVNAALSAAKLDNIEATIEEKISAALTAAKLQELIEKVGNLEEELKTLKGE